MRIHDDRYNRDLRRFEVAMRFIQYEARTHTIRLWTGLTDDRIRKLYRSYLQQTRGVAPVRHRGKSPQQPAFFTRSARARHESALLASLCRLLGALPAQSEPARNVPGLNRGELLCQAYDSYRSLITSPLISFEHSVFLLGALSRGDELVLGACRDCSAVLVTDRWSLRAPRCIVCAPEAPEASAGLPLP
jgi:Flagellar transcriptional activator (FlhC)